MNDNKLKIASNAKDVRLCVIENSIYVEEFTSRVLGEILDIDWKNSKSFGHGSSCLSFNQKLQLVQDVKGVNKEDLKAINCLSQMRNKFAHVSHIDTFEKLFSDPACKDIKNYFFKRFFDAGDTSDIHPSKIELMFRLCFYLLVNDVIEILFKIMKQHWHKTGIEEAQQSFKDKMLVAFSKIAIPNQQLNILETLEETKRKLMEQNGLT